MSIFERFKESAGTGATILGFISIIGSVAVYGTNLKNQFDASQTKIVQLETQITTLREQLDKSYSAGAENQRGPKGDKGDPGERGEQGPRGERGPKGDTGNSDGTTTIDEAAVTELVRKLVASEVRDALSKSANSTMSAKASAQSNRGCISVDELASLKRFTLKDGDAICDAESNLVAKVNRISHGDSSIKIDVPGSDSMECEILKRCIFPWSDIEYINEDMVVLKNDVWSANLRRAP